MKNMLLLLSRRLHNVGKLSHLPIATKLNVFCLSKQRFSTMSCDGCNVEIDDETGIAVATMNRPPVNSFNLEFLQSLTSMISDLEKKENVKGLVITSGIPTIFSGGLDILEMYKAKPERASKFWEKLQDFWLKLYLSPLVTMAVVNGNSPAGGCVVAMSCDYRVMASGKYRIGLNETQLGLVVPFWFIETLMNTIGHREAERAVQLGYLYSPEEALKVGLVDEVVKEENVLDAVKKQMKIWLEIPNEARIMSKSMLRQNTADKLINKKQEDVELFVGYLLKERTQKSIGIYLDGLKKKKTKD